MLIVEGGKRVRGGKKNSGPEKPLVSIVTPIFNLLKNNREHTFRKMLNSIIGQDYGNSQIEHIVIDGGSIDGTVDLIEEYDRKGFIDYWISEPDSGVYQAMNKGAALASGNIINFSSSDDYFTLDAVSSSVSAIVNKNADFSYGLTTYLLENGDVWYVAGKKYSWNQIYFGMPVGHQSLFVKTACFKQIGAFSENHCVLSDYLFSLQLHLQGYRGASTDRMSVYFRHYGGKSSGATIMFEEFYEQYKITAALLNIHLEEFLLFLYFSNLYLGKGIIQKRPELSLLESALQGLRASPNRELSLNFQKSLIFCLYRNIHFSSATAGEVARLARIDGLGILNGLGSVSPLLNNCKAFLYRLPFEAKSEDALIRLDSILCSLSASSEQLHLLDIQQIIIRYIYALIECSLESKESAY